MNCKQTIANWTLLALLLLTGCNLGDGEDAAERSQTDTLEQFQGVPIDSDSAFLEELEESGDYLNGHDFDGDGAADEIYFEYTGGAHCCYLPRVKLSSDGELHEYLLEMDGGYIFGMPDGSQPNQFEIGDFDGDGLEEIFIEIFCYNGRCEDLPQEWVDDYGVQSNWLVMEFEEGEWRLRGVENRRNRIQGE